MLNDVLKPTIFSTYNRDGCANFWLYNYLTNLWTRCTSCNNLKRRNKWIEHPQRSPSRLSWKIYHFLSHLTNIFWFIIYVVYRLKASKLSSFTAINIAHYYCNIICNTYYNTTIKCTNNRILIPAYKLFCIIFFTNILREGFFYKIPNPRRKFSWFYFENKSRENETQALRVLSYNRQYIYYEATLLDVNGINYPERE